MSATGCNVPSFGSWGVAQAFYIPWGAELNHWAQSHPEYTAQQVESLIAAIADTNGIKRRERVAVLAEIQGEIALS